MSSDGHEAGADEQLLGQLFKASMSRLASSVVIVTCFVGGRPWGLTVSACCSVSAEPPMLLVSLAQATASAAAIREQRRFGVSILGAAGLHVARAGSASGAPKFIEEFCSPGDGTAAGDPPPPAVEGALAHLDCEVAEAFDVSDHVIFVGRVTRVRGHVAAAASEPSPAPLIHFGREFYTLSGGQRVAG